jgi:N-acetylmuramic acid 6-phosphate etherase
MAGGDFALIRSVEGFEDYVAFGRKQLGDLGVSDRDVVFAITEGGETSFVIGTAWQGVDAGAKVFFVYNNPDAVLCAQVQRSREVIEEPRIEKINLTTGPMAITGSTRMQATSIQLCVMLTILEMVVREFVGEGASDCGRLDPADVPLEFLHALEEMHRTLRSKEVLEPLATLVELEERVYCGGGRNNYFAGQFGMDVLTDTTERSPTYCTPPFRKFDDATAADSWAFLFLPRNTTPEAWSQLLQREPRCVEWSDAEVRELVDEQQVEKVLQTVRKIGRSELMRFRIGLDGLADRELKAGDSAVGIVSWRDSNALAPRDGFFHAQLASAERAGARVGLIQMERATEQGGAALLESWSPVIRVRVPVPATRLLLDGVTRVGLKLLLNALSTCTMVRLGRVMGNCMIWVVASNLKLIDRAARYIQNLTGLDYEAASRALFEAMDYVEPRLKSDRAYPPVVGLTVLRVRDRLSLEEAEERLAKQALAGAAGSSLLR